MVVKALDVKFVISQAPRGVWGHATPGNFSNRTLRNAVSSVSQAGPEFTQVLFKK